MDTLAPEMVKEVCRCLDFWDRARLGATCRHLRRHVFYKYPIDFPRTVDPLNCPVGSFPGLLATLRAALSQGAAFHTLSLCQLLGGLRAEEMDALLRLVLEKEARAPKLHFLELDVGNVAGPAALPLPSLVCCTALQGLRLEGGGLAGHLGFLGQLPALRILDLKAEREPFTTVDLDNIPIGQLSDLRIGCFDQASAQAWLNSLLILPELLSLRLFRSSAPGQRLTMRWSKVPALRWLEGDFEAGSIGQLSCLERWVGIQDPGDATAMAAALVSVLANPLRLPGRPLCVNATDVAIANLVEDSLVTRGDGEVVEWLENGDKFSLDLHCPPVGWNGYKWLI